MTRFNLSYCDPIGSWSGLAINLEHFSNPVGSGRRRRGDKGGNDGSKNNSEDEDSSSDAESETVSSSYLANIGRVVWAENTDKKAKGRRSAALLRHFTHNL